MWHAYSGLLGGRYRRYLSLREGSETGQIGQGFSNGNQPLFAPHGLFSQASSGGLVIGDISSAFLKDLEIAIEFHWNIAKGNSLTHSG